MENNLEKFEKILDEIRVIRDLDEFKSNSPTDYEDLIKGLTNMYEEIIMEASTLDDADITKANELVDKLINAQPDLKELKEKFETRSKVIMNLKELEQTKNNLLKIDNITEYKERHQDLFEKDIESIIRTFSTITANVDKYSDDYNKAVSHIKDVCNKHPELKEFEKLFLQEKLETKSIEEQTKEITMKFEKEKQKVKVNSLTEEIEKLKEKKVTNQKELNDYRDLIEQYKKDILNNPNMTNEEKQELINKLDKDNQIISMLEIIIQKDNMQGGPSL